MFSNELNIDVQIYQEEVKKPSNSSQVLVPIQNKSEIINQLLLKWSDRESKLTQKNIDEVTRNIFREWESTFPLYKIERAFAEVSSRGSIEVYVTFDSKNIFSNTQIRNIKKTITDLLVKELEKITVKNETTRPEQVESNRFRQTGTSTHKKATDVDQVQRRAELDLRDRFNTLKKENNELQMALQQSKADELSQKESIGQLKLQMERQQRVLNEMNEGKNAHNTEEKERNRQLQEQLDDVNYRLRQSSQELLERQREIQQLQLVVSDNENYINGLQADYEQLRTANNTQIEQLLEENDMLKTDLIDYRNSELDDKQKVQIIKNELHQLTLEKENIQEDLKQKLQRMEYENDELRTVFKENQVFEDKTQQDLNETTRELTKFRDDVKRLETENSLLTREWETRYQNLSNEKEELAIAYNSSRQMDVERQNELIQLKNNVVSLEQNLQQAGLEQQRSVSLWEERVSKEERETTRILQQATLDKEQFSRNKEQEIKRLSDRLAQQQGLVDKLMLSQKETQENWQENYQLLETNYKTARDRSTQLEQEISRLLQDNQLLETKLAGLEQRNTRVVSPVIPVAPVVAAVVAPSVAAIVEQNNIVNDSLQAEIDNEVASLDVPKAKVAPKVEKEIAYEEEVETEAADSDYDYDYDEYGYDDEYEYDDEYDDDDVNETDDLLGYDAETVKEDIEELLDNTDDEDIEKVSKKDFAIFEERIDGLKRLFEKTEDVDFKNFVAPKMKKYNKLKNKLDEDVKGPKLFSPKYKIESGLFNEIKAYALMSRHLQLLAGEDDEEEYDYDGYDYDYGYDYE